jgi:ATP-dependent Lon protease
MHDPTATLSHVVCQGVQRMRVLDFIPGTPFLTARALEIPEPASSSPEIERGC